MGEEREVERGLANVSPYIRQHVLQLFVFALFFQMHFPGQESLGKSFKWKCILQQIFPLAAASFFYFYYFYFFRGNLAIVDDIWKSGKHAAMTLNEHSRTGKGGRAECGRAHIRQGFPDAKCRPTAKGGEGGGSNTRKDSSGLKMKINNAICHVASLLAQPEEQQQQKIQKKMQATKTWSAATPSAPAPPSWCLYHGILGRDCRRHQANVHQQRK